MTAALLSAAEMRAIEARAIASGAVTGLALMERAGEGAVAAMLSEWPALLAAEAGGVSSDPLEHLAGDARLAAPQAVVLCGPGNNGGDGFVIARLLAARGWTVAAFLLGDPERLPPDARANQVRWAALGPTAPFTPDALAATAARLDPARPILVADALFGTGLARPLAPEVHEAWGAFAAVAGPRHDICLCAIDVPSGVSEAEPAGRRLALFDDPARPRLTVSFHALKRAHAAMLASGERVAVAAIGLPGRAVLPEEAFAILAPGPDRIAALAKTGGAHKYGHGHALVLSGPAGRGGAARLAARGALRIGAGLATVGAPEAAMAEHAARLDAVMLRPIGEGDALAAALGDPRINALCLGPGLGTDARGEGLVAAALAAPGRRVLLDADALTLIAQAPALRAALHDGCALTPHAGEFARLFPAIAARGLPPPLAVRAAAAEAGCTVLLKGPLTAIGAPGGRVAVHAAIGARAAPWLATAGSGDVLAGFAAGLMARGLPPFEAAATAAWLHVECALSFGPGLIAEDIPEELPKVFRALGLGAPRPSGPPHAPQASSSPSA